MSLSDDLLSQARHLASLEPRRPRQASLRRSISSAYYSIFHLLIADACRKIASPNKRLQERLSRCFDHRTMFDLCSRIAKGTQSKRGNKAKVLDGLLPSPIPQDLVLVAEMFIQLQQARHTADYDIGFVHDRITARLHLGEAEAAAAAWRRVRDQNYAQVFLVALLLGNKLDR